MAYRQIALLGCVGSHTTPFMSTKEDFSGVVVSGLGEGDEVRLQAEGVQDSVLLLAGLTPFPSGIGRFVIRKLSGPSPRPTSVEIIRGGT